jgi:hypothetical protein
MAVQHRPGCAGTLEIVLQPLNEVPQAVRWLFRLHQQMDMGWEEHIGPQISLVIVARLAYAACQMSTQLIAVQDGEHMVTAHGQEVRHAWLVMLPTVVAVRHARWVHSGSRRPESNAGT